MARAALQWRVADVGKAAHVALATVMRLELEYAIIPQTWPPSAAPWKLRASSSSPTTVRDLA
jgi:hypothetical protein